MIGTELGPQRRELRRACRIGLVLALAAGVLPGVALAAGQRQILTPKTIEAPSSAIPAAPLVFTNSAPITIPATGTQGVASAYPSTINVPAQDSDLFITDVRVRLNGLSHTFPSDLDLLLVDPNGNTYVLMALNGQGDDLTAVNLTFDDHAPTGLPKHLPITSGSFRPRDYRSPVANLPPPAPQQTVPDPYNAPAPAGNKTLYDAFAGNSPGGTWSLYIVDRANNDTGTIAGGWTLMFTVEYQFTFFPTVNILDSGSPPTKANPYPATINVSGMGRKLREVSLTFYQLAHNYPNDIDMLLVAPGGRAFVVMSDAGGINAQTPVVFQVSDRGTGPIPSNGLPSFATFTATNYSGADAFPAPAPAPPYGNTSSAAPPYVSTSMSNFFDGIDPNGDWSLYIIDDQGGDSGSIVQWALSLTSYPEYDSAAGLTLNNGAKATPYPSTIAVQDVPGIRTGAYVRFNNFTHSNVANVDALLTNSNSGRLAIQADAGGSGGVNGITYAIDDNGGSAMPNAASLTTGSVYRPTDFSAASFPSPAPGPYGFAAPTGSATFRSAFLGGNPNGGWSLYVNGGGPGGSGSIGSWTLGVPFAYDGIFIDSMEDTDLP